MSSILYSKRHDPSIGRGRKKRAKSFKTEELAKEYAKKNNITDYKIVVSFKGKISLKQ
jgi:hypothetical protein